MCRPLPMFSGRLSTCLGGQVCITRLLCATLSISSSKQPNIPAERKQGNPTDHRYSEHEQSSFLDSSFMDVSYSMDMLSPSEPIPGGMSTPAARRRSPLADSSVRHHHSVLPYAASRPVAWACCPRQL